MYGTTAARSGRWPGHRARRCRRRRYFLAYHRPKEYAHGRLAHLPLARLRVHGHAARASKGVRNGAIIDIDAAGLCAGRVVEAAEAMARESVDRVIVNLSSNGIASKQKQTAIPLGSAAIGTAVTNVSAICAKNASWMTHKSPPL